MKIGKGSLLAKGRVSVRVTHEGKSRQVTLASVKPKKIALPFWGARAGDWYVTPSCIDPQPWQIDSWKTKSTRVDWISKQDIDALWAEVQRTVADPGAQARAERARESSRRGHMKQKLKASMAKVKKCMKALIAAGANTEELEQDMSELVKEAIVEAVQEA